MKLSGHSLMTWVLPLLAVLHTLIHARAHGVLLEQGASPINTVLAMLTQLQKQVVEEGDAEHETYTEYADWCETNSKQKQAVIDEEEDTEAEYKAELEKAEADIDAAEDRIAELATQTSADAVDIKAMALIQDKDKKDWEELDEELTTTIDTIAKAREVMEEEFDKVGIAHASAFLQRPTKGMQLFVTALHAVVDTAVGISEDNRENLAELLQTREGEQSKSGNTEKKAEDGHAVGRWLLSKRSGTRADPYEEYSAKSTKILEILKDMEEETASSQSKARKEYLADKDYSEEAIQRLKDRAGTEDQEIAAQKMELADAKQKQAAAEGKLDTAKAGESGEKALLKELQQGCMEKAAEYEMQVKTRTEETEALAAAKKVLQSISFTQTSKAQAHNQGAAPISFAQVDIVSDAHAKTFALAQVVFTVHSKLQRLATGAHSMALGQLASRIGVMLRRMKRGTSASGADPFEKVKELIQDMIDKLEAEGIKSTRQKDFCDEEMKSTESSKADRESSVETLDTRITAAMAETARLKQERTETLAEVSDIEESQSKIEAMRKEEKDVFNKVSRELKDAVSAIQKALKILRDFYNSQEDDSSSLLQDMASSMDTAGAAAAAGAGGGTAILGLLEVCESDFSKNLAEVDSAEDGAVGEYEEITAENKKQKSVKSDSITNLATELAHNEKIVAEYKGDRVESQEELDAILEYYEKISKQCVETPTTYADIVARRKEEIEGLEDALTILKSAS
jgi:hypothetical protein